MAAEDSTTWGEVCDKVGFADNLYSDCRKRVSGYTGGNRSLDEVPDDDEDWGPDSKNFGRQLADSALAIPDAPGDDWKDDAGFFESMPIKQILMYGGVAALIWFFMAKARAPQEVVTTTGASGAVPEKLTSPKAA
jgi:hypothetical protein